MKQEVLYYPMTIGQGVLIFADKYCLIRSWMNIAAVIDIHSPIDEQLMLQAMTLTMMRTPSARLRLHKQDKKTVVQYFSDATPTGIELVDMSDLSEKEVETRLTKWAQTPFPNKSFDTQLYNVKLVKRNNGFCSLFVCFYHMEFDSYTLMTTVRYIFDVYKALSENTALPKELGSPIPMYEADDAYYHSKQYEIDREYWKGRFANGGEPQFTSLYGKDGKYNTKNQRSGKITLIFQNKTTHDNLAIPAELTKKVRETAEAWHISQQSFYELAIRSYLSEICDTNDVTLLNAVARRAKKVQKAGGGTMVNAVNVRMIIDRETTSFREACTTVFHTLNDIYRHSNYDFSEVSKISQSLYPIKPGVGYASITLCFQPYFTLGGEDMNISFHRLNNGGASMPLYLTIMPCDKSDTLMCNYEHTPYYSSEQVQTLHAYILKFLENATKEPDATLKELIAKSL